MASGRNFDVTTLPVKPERAVLYWTSGSYMSTPEERQRFHALVEACARQPRVVSGARLDDPELRLALCGMYGSREGLVGPCPITPGQVDALVDLCAKVSIVHGLPVDERHFYTRWEAHHIHALAPARFSEGVTMLPHLPGLRDVDIGPWLRARIREHAMSAV